MTNNNTQLSPTSGSNRYHSLDLIRGIAVAGILIMNIYAFGNIFSYYVNPMALGEPSMPNLITWVLTHIFADQKFYTLFSMLFGAGIMLMAERAEAAHSSPAGLHYKRMGWMLVFGLIHALLIWYGDILVAYSIAGLWVYLFALHTKPITKLIVGSILIAIILVFMSSFALFVEQMPEADTQQMREMFQPPQTIIDKETVPYITSYSAQVAHRTQFFFHNLPMSAFFFGFFRIGGSMLIGMALYQLGILTAQRSRQFYFKLMSVGFVIGFGLIAYDTFNLLSNNFDLKASMLSFMTTNSLGAIFVALGYIALICLWAKSDKMAGLRQRLEAVGRMAFTNYLSQSIICTLLFYSHGFGLFTQLERYQLMLVVAVIFVAQLLWSPWWLKRFKFGPLEWLWRSLSYGKRQPFKRT